jgi:hypothetical protein
MVEKMLEMGKYTGSGRSKFLYDLEWLSLYSSNTRANLDDTKLC